MKIMKKYKKHFAQTFKNHFNRNFVKFTRWLLQELAKNYGNYYNFREKLQRNPKEILEIFGTLSKICPGRFKALSGTENTANIFQNNSFIS